jgi:hypothetical protein
MLYGEVIVTCSEFHKNHGGIFCGRNIEFLNIEPGGT